ncbi:MAG: hypothetical protein IJ132_02560 [Firmicutes bacterium]|nr:hypothetical protein [Bacillota bacterium]
MKEGFSPKVLQVEKSMMREGENVEKSMLKQSSAGMRRRGQEKAGWLVPAFSCTFSYSLAIHMDDNPCS